MTSLPSLGFNSRDPWGYHQHELKLQLTLPMERKKFVFCRKEDTSFKICSCHHSNTYIFLQLFS